MFPKYVIDNIFTHLYLIIKHEYFFRQLLLNYYKNYKVKLKLALYKKLKFPYLISVFIIRSFHLINELLNCNI